jgi:hypothetical protein
MAYGRPGSTLVEELNRLANGGVLPPKTEWMDDEGAANKLATTLMGDKYPDSATRIGAQKTMAAIGGASAPANF